MKAARLYEYDEHMNVDLVIEERPVPQVTRPGDVIIKVGAAGLCRTDLHIIEGVWKDIQDPQRTLLPYILGHENAGWVEDVGPGVTSVKIGDPVICHPLRTCGVCMGCRSGEDMYCSSASFPGLNTDGGFADYLLTNERALIKLNPNVAPIDVAPMADAGITAYRVAKKAAKHLRPGQYCVILGVGGLGHVSLQSIHELCGARTIAVDRSPAAQALSKELGAHYVLDGGNHVVEEVKQITGGGAHAVIDFVGELGAEQVAWQMLRQGGTHYIVGYGGEIKVPTVQMVISEIAIAGSLVGNYMELVELMELNAEGRVKLHAQQYKLNDINKALSDFKERKIVGRGVIVPG
jgi:NAD+-dependent secondary alcohol dehydrogenase Adh1